MALEIVNGIHAWYIKCRMWASIVFSVFSQYKNPFILIRGLYKVLQMKNNLVSRHPIRKLVKIDNRYFWDFNQPGWPSESFRQNFRWMSKQLLDKENKHPESVRLVFLAITKKCPMQCLHCYEWDEINKPEVITLYELQQIVAKYQQLGAASFILGGGEPLSRFDDLIELLKSAKPTSDFWISTSGFGLTAEKAKALKDAGLTGVSISIDHYDEAANNTFRGHNKAMEIACEAAKNSLSAGLGLAVALCATKEFISKENLYRYAEFSKQLGAGFIWLIEPRAEGRFRDKDVELNKEHFNILDEFFFTMNNKKEYLDYPRVLFPNYNHRHIGCAGAGTSNIMIDTDGYVNPCPFCRKKIVHALATDSEPEVKRMILEGCFKFKSRYS